MVGNPEEYPGAYMVFKIRVEQPKQASSSTTSSVANLSKRSSQAKQFSKGFQDAERKEKMNQEIEKLKQKYQPMISSNAEVLEQYKRQHHELMARK